MRIVPFLENQQQLVAAREQERDSLSEINPLTTELGIYKVSTEPQHILFEILFPFTVLLQFLSGNSSGH